MELLSIGDTEDIPREVRVAAGSSSTARKSGGALAVLQRAKEAKAKAAASASTTSDATIATTAVTTSTSQPTTSTSVPRVSDPVPVVAEPKARNSLLSAIPSLPPTKAEEPLPKSRRQNEVYLLCDMLFNYNHDACLL
jgi:hypothetical protein